MSVLVYIDTLNGSIAKNALEAVNYGSKIGSTTVVTNGTISDGDLASLGKVGAVKVLVNREVTTNDASQITNIVATAADSCGATTVVFSQDLVGRALRLGCQQN